MCLKEKGAVQSLRGLLSSRVPAFPPQWALKKQVTLDVSISLYSQGASLAAQLVKNPPAMQETQVPLLGWGDPWRRKWQPTPVLLPGKSYGQRRLVGHSPWG